MVLSFKIYRLAAALVIGHHASVAVAQDYTQMMRLLRSAERSLPKPTTPPSVKVDKPAPNLGHLSLDLNKDISEMEDASSTETAKQRSDVWVQHVQAQLDDLDPDQSAQSGDVQAGVRGPHQGHMALVRRPDLPLGGPLSLKNEDTVMSPLDADYSLPALPADPPESLMGLASVAAHKVAESMKPVFDVVGAAKELLAAPLELQDAQTALRGTPYEPTADSIVNAARF